MEKKKLIYLSHPFGNEKSNYDEITSIMVHLYNNDKFFEQFCIISPVHAYGVMYEEMEYDRGLQVCMDIMDYVHIVLIIGDWQSSKGCVGEHKMAVEKNIPYVIIEDVKDVLDVDPERIVEILNEKIGDYKP